MAFEMSSMQLNAAQDAMNGTGAEIFSHLIHFMVGALVLIWFFCIFLGIWKALQEGRIDLGDALAKFSLGIFTLICVGALIVY